MLIKKPKPKTCAYSKCRKKFTPVRLLQQVCSLECGWSKAQEDSKKKEKHDWSIEKKRLKEKNKTLGQYEAEAKTEFQKWVRLRDKDLPCISCGNFHSARYDGGHYFKAELYSGLIFHVDNCHKQCSRPCNKDLNGDQANYRIGLVNRIGLERVTWLEENKDRLRVYKFTKQELIDIKEYYKNKIKELSK